MIPTSLLCIQILVFDLVQLAVCNVVSSENLLLLFLFFRTEQSLFRLKHLQAHRLQNKILQI